MDSWKCWHGGITGACFSYTDGFPNDNNHVSFLYGTYSCPCFLLQRLAKDSNPAIAAAASKTIFELKKQWEIEEGDSWRFMMNPKPAEGEETEEGSDDADTN